MYSVVMSLDDEERDTTEGQERWESEGRQRERVLEDTACLRKYI